MLILSAGLGGDGVLEKRPRWVDVMPVLSVLFFLSGSFSTRRVSLLRRLLDETEAFRDISLREVLRAT